jgi:D-alanyl-D-alanine carboxypeptidase
VRRAARVRTAAFFPASANPWNLPAPDLPARTYLLIETQSGTELAAHNADMRLPPASLTKLRTPAYCRRPARLRLNAVFRLKDMLVQSGNKAITWYRLDSTSVLN